MPEIEAPDGKIIQFPDTMKGPEIEAAMRRLYPPARSFDLSQLSDEQRGVYRDLLAKRQGPAPLPGTEKLGGQPPAAGSKPPPPKALQGPAPSIGQRALQNLPLSLAFLPEKLTQMTPGAPAGMETLENGRYAPDPIRDVKEYGHGLVNLIGNTRENFANDPAGTLANAASTVAGLGRSGFGRGLTEGVKIATRTPGSKSLSLVGSLIGSPLGGGRGAATGAALGYSAPKLIEGFKAGARELHPPGLIQLSAEKPPNLLGPARSNLGGPADTSGVTITRGEPLGRAQTSRQLAPGSPTPPEPLRSPRVPPARQLERGPLFTQPPADASKVMVTTGEPLSYAGPRQLTAGMPKPLSEAPSATPRVSLRSGGFAAGPQINFVEPSETLANNLGALARARALRDMLVQAGPRALE